MNHKWLFNGNATLEDLYWLNVCGYEFVINNGEITQIIINRGDRNA